MKIKKELVFGILIIISLVLLVVFLSRSSFGEIIGMNREYSCEKDNRLYPSGHVSGNYLNMNKYERDKLLVDFIKNGNTT